MSIFSIHIVQQKRKNKNSNDFLREFYSKVMNLPETNDNELNDELNLINNKPRKYNDYISSN